MINWSVVGLALLLQALPASATEPAGLEGTHAEAVAARQAERAGLAEQRRTIERRFDDQQLQCRNRFAVTACADAARRERREAFDALRGRETRLDQAERRARLAEREQRIAERMQTAVPPKAPEPVRAASAPETAATVARSSAAPRGTPAPAPPRPPALAASRPPAQPLTPRLSAAEQARRQATHAQRQSRAAAHRAEVEQRHVDRLQQNQRAAPLPSPGQPASAPAKR